MPDQNIPTPHPSFRGDRQSISTSLFDTISKWCPPSLRNLLPSSFALYSGRLINKESGKALSADELAERRLSPASITTGTVVAQDRGKCVFATGDINIPTGVMEAGDVLFINNTTGSAIEITSDATLRLAGSSFIGDVQLAAYGICGILFESLTTAKVSGTGLAATGDEDAEAFFSAAGITDADVKAAVEDFTVALKAGTLWDKMLAVYPMVQDPGDDDLEPHRYNLKNPAAYLITWAGSPVPSDNGVTGDNSTAYGDTGLNANTTTPNSLAFGFYSRSNVNAAEVPMGAWGSASGTGFEIYPRFSGSAIFDNMYNGGAGRATGAVADSLGLFVSSRTASNSHAGYKNGVLVNSTTGAQGSLESTNFHLFVRGESPPWASHNLSFAFISEGLDAAEVLELYTAVQALQTALGREV